MECYATHLGLRGESKMAWLTTKSKAYEPNSIVKNPLLKCLSSLIQAAKKEGVEYYNSLKVH